MMSRKGVGHGGGDQLPRVILLSSSDPLDVHSFSGSIYYMAQALKSEIPGMEIVRSSRPFWFEPLQRLLLRSTKGRVDPYYWPILNRWFAKRLQNRWHGQRVVIIGIVNAALVAELASSMPVINISDSTYDLMRTEHEVFWSLDPITAARAEEAELHSIKRSVHNSFSSQWAAASAVGHYGARPEDVSVISWGCNFDIVPAADVRPSAFIRSECRLLFIGGEWFRKGGDIVCAATEILAAKGIPLRVDLVGVAPPEDLPPRPWLYHHGYLSKADHEQLALLRSLMRDADLLFLPTRKDCTPMVFAEANAYGTPALTRDVGGVADVVRDGANGIVLTEDADAAQFAAAIESLWNDPVHYAQLRSSARHEYETRLNWAVWAQRIAQLVEDLASAGRI
jgi:glycosyltransferase involved in cell wall biosynthesis